MHTQEEARGDTWVIRERESNPPLPPRWVVTREWVRHGLSYGFQCPGEQARRRERGKARLNSCWAISCPEVAEMGVDFLFSFFLNFSGWNRRTKSSPVTWVNYGLNKRSHSRAGSWKHVENRTSSGSILIPYQCRSYVRLRAPARATTQLPRRPDQLTQQLLQRPHHPSSHIFSFQHQRLSKLFTETRALMSFL